MSLDEAVKLVLFAFENAQNGDIFVQKASSSTIEDLAKAIGKLFGLNTLIDIIGTRHGEKLYETLLTSEEFIVAKDLGDYFRIPADQRSLNYDKYFEKGTKELDNILDYNSHNVNQLSVSQIIEKLKKLDYIQNELKSWSRNK